MSEAEESRIARPAERVVRRVLALKSVQDLVAELRWEARLAGDEIRARLEQFRAVPRADYFYELCYCLMTPQSSAQQCFAVQRELQRRAFEVADFDPEPLLRSFQGGYVRFHRTKARNLIELKTSFATVPAILADHSADKQAREKIVAAIRGLGYKEASHFLRNVGRTNVAILDRHILENMRRLKLIDATPAAMTRKRYLEIEALFEALADAIDVPADELDLLLWRRQTGMILK